MLAVIEVNPEPFPAIIPEKYMFPSLLTANLLVPESCKSTNNELAALNVSTMLALIARNVILELFQVCVTVNGVTSVEDVVASAITNLPVTFPEAADKFPAPTVPVTVNVVNEPTLVIFGCAAVVNVPVKKLATTALPKFALPDVIFPVTFNALPTLKVLFILLKVKLALPA